MDKGDKMLITSLRQRGNVSKGIKGGRWKHAGFSEEDFENFFCGEFRAWQHGLWKFQPKQYLHNQKWGVGKLSKRGVYKRLGDGNSGKRESLKMNLIVYICNRCGVPMKD